MTEHIRMAALVWLNDIAYSITRADYTPEQERRLAQSSLQFIKELEEMASKEMTAVKPTWQCGKAYCGRCGKRIPMKIGACYCHKCGRKIQWKP